ncbi:uncharacterized protein LAJ45_02925 [Morchella importuna]|uniref:uncharacterized protein n=1 Tax=Morchella importuna TaxID=1174673 RepID=UPI001E8D7041|nr:uncharacterized protein LAJ45_02925 [Morchella importuna]KAH8153338.1 hypothetical protein LAJ45_02925 [Morchella importuna]
MHLPTILISTLALLLSTPALAAQRKARQTDLEAQELASRIRNCASANSGALIDGDYSQVPAYCSEYNYGMPTTTTGSDYSGSSYSGSDYSGSDYSGSDYSGSGSGSGYGSSSGSGSDSGSGSGSGAGMGSLGTGAGVRNGAWTGGALALGVVAVVMAMI